ncbi:MAG: trypsin-like peptidase domain-containing protein [Planctomycetaceae bacterium]|nr:trypsin-like peptidase domain-containing protein [Planctomycetaceae bacterium]
MYGSILRTTLVAIVFTASLSSALPADPQGPRVTPLVKAVQQCRQSVVNIHTERSADSEKEARFFSPKSRKITGMGTGIVIDERGYIATNYHVIQNMDLILVTLHDGTSMEARPVSFDRKHDLAVIQVSPEQPLTVMSFGTSSDLMIAETVFAVGNAYGYEHTITSGIISAIARNVEVDETQSYENLIQTDASINPGNSGGPLLNLNGDVIGINVAMHGAAQRIGFAIPIDDARRVLARLMSVEQLEGIPHGLETTDIKTANESRLIVNQIVPGSAADLCGIQRGDVIRSVRGVRVADGTDLERSLLGQPVGKVVDLVVQRGDQERTLHFTVGIGRPSGASASTTAVSQQATRPQQSSRPSETVTAETSAATPTLPALPLPQPAAAPAGKTPSLQVSQSTPSADQAAGDPGLDRAWELLGIRLTPIDDRDRALIAGRYKGGMKVALVRSGSVASRFGIRNGDVLLGLDSFETFNSESLRFIMDESRIQKTTVMPFLLIRQGVGMMEGRLDIRNARR